MAGQAWEGRGAFTGVRSCLNPQTPSAGGRLVAQAQAPLRAMLASEILVLLLPDLFLSLPSMTNSAGVSKSSLTDV